MTRRQRAALWSVVLGSSVVFLDGTVVNLALPHMADSLHAGFSGLQWVVEGYLLTLSAFILLGGTLGDIWGRKRIYFIGLVGFGLTSILCAVSTTIAWLIAARLLQGVFGALLVPGALAIIDTSFRPAERGAAFGRWTAWSAAATAIGPLIGGYLIDALSWRWIFFMNVPLIMLSCLLALSSIVESRDPALRRLDVRGAFTIALALAGTTYSLIQGPVQHWSWPTVAAGLAGLFFGGLFVWLERHTADPMISLDLFRSRNFTAINLITFALYGAFGGFFFSLMIHVQTVLGMSAVVAGLIALPITLLLIGLSSRAGAWAARRGPRRLLTAGPILAGGGILALLPLHAGSDYWRDIMPGIILFGLGLAITVAPLTATVMGSVAQEHAGIASAVNNAVSRVAGLLVVALLGLVSVAYSYSFSLIICGTLALAGGGIAWFCIQDDVLIRRTS